MNKGDIVTMQLENDCGWETLEDYMFIGSFGQWMKFISCENSNVFMCLKYHYPVYKWRSFECNFKYYFYEPKI